MDNNNSAVEYRKAKKEEAVELVDFINMVFSQLAVPHDFKARNPSMYDSEYPFWDDHYVAVENGKILGTVALSDFNAEVAGMKLKFGHIGQVSVHKYHRGRGFMKKLMSMAIEDMKKGDYDFSNLGGQRQRYEYFGYSQANFGWRFEISSTNIRHKLEGREPQLTCDGKLLFKDGRQLGYIGKNAFVMENEDDYKYTVDAIAAFFKASGESSVGYSADMHELERIKQLSRIAEHSGFSHSCMVRIFNFRRCIESGLKLRAAAGLCDDGEVTLRVGGECFGLRVSGNTAESFDTDTAEYTFEPHELQTLALSPFEALTTAEKRIPRGWFPIRVG